MRAFQLFHLVLCFTILLQLSSYTYGYHGDAMHRLGQMSIIPNPLLNPILNTDQFTMPCEQDYTTEEIVSSFPSSKRSTAAVRIIPTYISPTITPTAEMTYEITASTSEPIEINAEISAAVLQLTPNMADIVSSNDNDMNGQILATNETTKVSKRRR